MGIESDQVVYEYLSRVGDVAQQRQLSSATRMRLVSELRDEIDRCRARAAVDSPAAVRRILVRLGSPDDIVAAAGGADGRTAGSHGEARTQGPAVPVQREPAPKTGAVPGSAPWSRPAPGPARTAEAAEAAGTDDEAAAPGRRRPKGLRRVVPRPRPGRPARPETDPAPPAGGAVPPHLATADQLGGGAGPRPDWWRTDDSPFGLGDDVPAGFVGGVEIPDLLKAPPPKTPAEAAEAVPAADAPGEAQATGPDAAGAGTAPRRRFPLLPRRAPKAAGRAGRWSNPLLLLAAALLVGGAVTGNLFALLFGWVIAYGSRRLTPTESKWAVVGMPGLALAAGLLWLWGRNDGRWGTPIAQGHMNDAVSQTWPWVVRTAAVLSALFLLWRSQRRR
ncbi:hypothetical protein [Streptomyces sp. NPDC056160]|uniref:hypothetical protein n=1 Tax=Streptomyces sp. NPDC056160 TaxID=3345731 RepID=UPI0035E04DDE